MSSRFGNFIGEAVDSDEEGSQIEETTGADAYVDLDDDEPEERNDQQLMELDGMRRVVSLVPYTGADLLQTKVHRTR